MSTKIVTGVCRASYAHVWTPKVIQEGQPPKYSVAILIPKTDEDTLKAVRDAIRVETLTAYPKGNPPAGFKTPLKDGDVIGRPETMGCWVLNASSREKPGIVNKDRQPILDKSELYSGCYCRFQISFAAYDRSVNKGVGCYLNNIQKVRDGQSLSGRDDPSEVFSAPLPESDGDFMS